LFEVIDNLNVNGAVPACCETTPFAVSPQFQQCRDKPFSAAASWLPTPVEEEMQDNGLRQAQQDFL